MAPIFSKMLLLTIASFSFLPGLVAAANSTASFHSPVLSTKKTVSPSTHLPTFRNTPHTIPTRSHRPPFTFCTSTSMRKASTLGYSSSGATPTPRLPIGNSTSSSPPTSRSSASSPFGSLAPSVNTTSKMSQTSLPGMSRTSTPVGSGGTSPPHSEVRSTVLKTLTSPEPSTKTELQQFATTEIVYTTTYAPCPTCPRQTGVYTSTIVYAVCPGPSCPGSHVETSSHPQTGVETGSNGAEAYTTQQVPMHHTYPAYNISQPSMQNETMEVNSTITLTSTPCPETASTSFVLGTITLRNDQ